MLIINRIYMKRKKKERLLTNVSNNNTEKKINVFLSDDIIDCDKRNLTYHFEDTQWPNRTMKVVSFEENLLVHVKPFPALEIRKLILRKNKITKIDNSAFKKIINLTELDLSYNQLTTENLQPQVFEVIIHSLLYKRFFFFFFQIIYVPSCNRNLMRIGAIFH